MSNKDEIESNDLEQTLPQNDPNFKTSSEEPHDESPLEEDSLQAKLELAESTSKEYLDRLQRTMAEFDNFRKRTNVEKASMYENGIISIIEKLLPIYDNFGRALNSTSDEEKNSNVFKGLEMIFKQFEDIFKSLNIEEVEGEGSSFDPKIHNAVLHVEDTSFGQNIVAEVLQKGYKYNDKVIRPSMVKVAN